MTPRARDWMDGVRRRPGRAPRPPAGPAERELPPPADDELEVEDPATSGLPVVVWLPIRCPECGDRRLRTDGTSGRLRYHSCLDCGTRFKSWELESSPE